MIVCSFCRRCAHLYIVYASTAEHRRWARLRLVSLVDSLATRTDTRRVEVGKRSNLLTESLTKFAVQTAEIVHELRAMSRCDERPTDLIREARSAVVACGMDVEAVLRRRDAEADGCRCQRSCAVSEGPARL